ncbi:MAG: hypothetical protein KGR26_00340 [Cyanobacteria bacterium REEB65]|nr:hypothetical protein [Cyanobacteria bacterium REEB65]
MIYVEIDHERAHQETKYGETSITGSRTTLIEALGYLAQEFGEVAKEVTKPPLNVSALRDELIDTAAVAVAMLERLDREAWT